MLNWDAILAFDRAGSLQWTFGGVNSDYQNATWDAQHGHHYLGDSMLLLINRGRNSGSSAREYQLSGDEAIEILDYSSGESTLSFGDVWRLPNGNTLVTYSNNGRLREVSPTGELIQTTDIGSIGIGYTVRRSSLYGPPPPYAE